MITQTRRDGTTWLLVQDDGPFITVPAWQLAQIDRGTDADGQPAMMLKFDDAGTQRLRQLTKANDGRLLAEIVYGVVVSTPTIRAGQNGLSSVVVSGIFSERQLDNTIASLRRGMVESPTQGDGSSPAAPSTGVGRRWRRRTRPSRRRPPTPWSCRSRRDAASWGPMPWRSSPKPWPKVRSLADSRCLWVPVQPGMNLSPQLVTQAHQGGTWLLVYSDTSLTMVPSQRWQLVHVGRSTDDNGRPMLVLRFDETGTEQMVRLTRAHGGQLLAIVIGGVVVSTPTIPERQEGIHCATITGAFTEQALADMTATLRQGMVEPFANDGGDFRPIRLGNGVTVRAIGRV